VLGHDNVWAGGDCTEVVDRITGKRRHMPQGTHANKHGRVIGLNISGQEAHFPGIVGTALARFQDVEVARVGLLEAEGPELGIQMAAATIEAKTRAGYFPGASGITVKMIGEPGTGRLLGCQILGGSGSAKRIDVAATAIWNGMQVAEVIDMDLGYSPPFSPPWDPVQTAARKLLGDL
jgi:NADPH-dependent 2,4-dienoyl-CoA reductase/sulfur reductase-like enzyme